METSFMETTMKSTLSKKFTTMMNIVFTLIFSISIQTSYFAVENPELEKLNTEHYRITLLRAAPGTFENLINNVKDYRQQHPTIVLRHSQGDHWDLMLIEPAGKNPIFMHDFSDLADFQHSFLAGSMSDWSTLLEKYKDSGLYHVEMFQAVHGKYAKLLQQRKMENQYLKETQQVENDIFETTFGSDMDIFTLGFHKNLTTFASSPDLSEQTFERAAVEAGFKNRADLSFYLRSLILSHHDTIATKVE